MGSDSGTPADSFYQVRPECADDVPKSRFKIKAGRTLSSRKWHSAFDAEGRLDIGRTLSQIYRGGIHPSIRGEVWNFYLVAMIQRVHLMKESRLDSDEGYNMLN